MLDEGPTGPDQHDREEQQGALKREQLVHVQSGASYLSQGFVMFFHASCEGLPGQLVAIVSANQLGELPKTLS